jgi:hypothetical protein
MMLIFFLFEAVLLGALLVASFLFLMTLCLGIRRLIKSNWRDGALLVASAALLAAALSCFPKLAHDIEYGIESKAEFLAQVCCGTALLALMMSLAVSGRAKWTGLASSIIILGLIAVARGSF